MQPCDSDRGQELSLWGANLSIFSLSFSMFFFLWLLSVFVLLPHLLSSVSSSQSHSLSSVSARPASDRRAPWVKPDFHLSNFTHLSASLPSFYIIIVGHETFSQRCINQLHKVWVTSERWSSRHFLHSTLHTY